jgi:periplasmic protein TonB
MNSRANHVMPSDERPCILAHPPSRFSTPQESLPICQCRRSAPDGHVLSSIPVNLCVEQHSTSVTCRGYCTCLVWSSMPLRCLLFSSNEEMVQPIWQVLTDLGIEGEYCRNAVDAVERVTTQLFQIVITDWEDQPEAAFLLKTARDLKAAQRPLTLAIVSDDARLPEALQAGANSVLVRPIRPEQVRDTMSTACELLRSKMLPSAAPPALPVAQPAVAEPVAMAAAASTGAGYASVSTPHISTTQSPEKTFRAGEFLQSSNSAPGTQFDTESDVQKSLDHAAASEVDALTELEPMAAAVQEAPPEPAEPAKPQEALTGWASLQARLTKNAPPPVEDAPPGNELLAYGETPSFGVPAASPPAEESKQLAKNEPHSEAEAALFSYMEGDAKEDPKPAPTPSSNRGRLILLAAAAIVCAVLGTMPRTRQSLQVIYRNGLHAGRNWLNPPPAPLPQPEPLHDSFGQSGDEYKLPAPGNIPDATTDPSQIQVLPVIDPTAKPAKGAASDATQAQPATTENNSTDQNQAGASQAGTNPAGPNQSTTNQPGQPQAGDVQVKDAVPTNAANVPGNAANASPAQVAMLPQVQPAPAQPSAPLPQDAPQQPPHPIAQTVQVPMPQHVVSTPSSVGIPSSLKSQIASTTPDASGTKPPEAAMSSIEPVKLPESITWGLLAQSVDPVYPDTAKASGQKGSVVLQVLIGRDGAVQDAKFLQGSLVFAKSAIDAVKQWHFKPYSMNGRAVLVQSTITLNFKPPA